MSADDDRPQSMRLVKVTPAMAAKFLENAAPNRTKKQRNMRKMVADMKAGAWRVNGTTLKFDTEDRLIDGQHRCKACIEANTPFSTYIVRGIQADAIHSIDTGAARTSGDFLSFHGFKNGNVVAASARNFALIMAAQPKRSKGYKATPTETLDSNRALLAYLKTYPLITDTSQWAMEYKNSLSGWMPMSLFAGAIAAISHIVDADWAMEFGLSMATGESINRASAIYKVRDRLLKAAMSPTVLVPRRVSLILILRAWGYWITDTPMTKGPGIRAQSIIPVVLGPDDPISKLQWSMDSRRRA